MSPALNGSSVLQRFKCDNAVKTRKGIMWFLSGTATVVSSYHQKYWYSSMLVACWHLLWGVKDWVYGFSGCIIGEIWINIITKEEAWHNCLLLLHVAPPLMCTVMSFQTTAMNSLAVPSPSLGVYQYNKLDMRTFCKQNFTIVSTPLHSISSDSTLYLWE